MDLLREMINSRKSMKKTKDESIEKEKADKDKDNRALYSQNSFDEAKDESIEKKNVDKDKRILYTQKSFAEAKESIDKARAIKDKKCRLMWDLCTKKLLKEAKESIEKGKTDKDKRVLHTQKSFEEEEAKECFQMWNLCIQKSFKEAEESIEKAKAERDNDNCGSRGPGYGQHSSGNGNTNGDSSEPGYGHRSSGNEVNLLNKFLGFLGAVDVIRKINKKAIKMPKMEQLISRKKIKGGRIIWQEQRISRRKRRRSSPDVACPVPMTKKMLLISTINIKQFSRRKKIKEGRIIWREQRISRRKRRRSSAETKMLLISTIKPPILSNSPNPGIEQERHTLSWQTIT